MKPWPVATSTIHDSATTTEYLVYGDVGQFGPGCVRGLAYPGIGEDEGCFRPLRLRLRLGSNRRRPLIQCPLFVFAGRKLRLGDRARVDHYGRDRLFFALQYKWADSGCR